MAFAGLFFIQTGFAQDKPESWPKVEGQPLKVNELVHKFGHIRLNARAEFKFVLENDASDVLVIKHVTTSCGCTSPSWDKKPVKPGKKATVKVKYDSSNPGVFTKSVFVYTNFADKPITLQIMGEVEPGNHPADFITNDHMDQTTDTNESE